MDEIVRQADILSLHLPLTPNTRGLVDAQFLGSMKTGAYLINTSRGEMVDEGGLLAALQGGKLGGAALDVLAMSLPARITRCWLCRR